MKKTFVLIDDDPYVHSDVRRVMAGIPELTMVASFLNVQDALDYFSLHEEGVDLILCDILMPGTDGYEAAELLYGYCDMWLFLTGKTDHGEEIFGGPAMGYLRKPIFAREVLEKINRLTKIPRKGIGQGGDPGFVMLNDRKSAKLVKVGIDDIHLIRIEEQVVNIYNLDTGERYVIEESLRTILGRLKNSGYFLRISGKVIISARVIESVDSDLMIKLKNVKELNGVSETYKPAARAFFKNWQLG